MKNKTTYRKRSVFYMKTLKKMWSNSLESLSIKHFNLMLTLTVKSVLYTYKILLTRLWWFIFGNIAAFTFLTIKYPSKQVAVICWFLTMIYTSFFSILAARSSVSLKDLSYFCHYKISFCMYLLSSLLYYVLIGVLLSMYDGTIGYDFNELASPVVAFFILFSCDKQTLFKRSIEALIEATRMAYYNLPFLIIACFMLAAGITFTVRIYTAGLSFLLKNIVHSSDATNYTLFLIHDFTGPWIFFPVLASFWSNFYIREVRGHFELYFPVIIKGEA